MTGRLDASGHGRRTDRIASGLAAVTLAIGIAVALVWVFRMPMLQCPDEDNHYDYALTLATIGRPIGPAEGDTAPDTHPTLRYLLKETNAFSIRFDPLARVSPAYGSKAFFEGLDRGAPAASPGAGGAPISRFRTSASSIRSGTTAPSRRS